MDRPRFSISIVSTSELALPLLGRHPKDVARVGEGGARVEFDLFRRSAGTLLEGEPPEETDEGHFQL